MCSHYDMKSISINSDAPYSKALIIWLIWETVSILKHKQSRRCLEIHSRSFRTTIPRCRQPDQLLSHSEKATEPALPSACQDLCSRGLQTSRHRSMLQIHPGTSYHACKYEKHASSDQSQLLSALFLCERWSQLLEYIVLPELTNDPKSSSYSQKLAQVKRSNTPLEISNYRQATASYLLRENGT